MRPSTSRLDSRTQSSAESSDAEVPDDVGRAGGGLALVICTERRSRVVSTDRPRAALLRRVTLTYFLEVAQVPRVIDRPIPRILGTDARARALPSRRSSEDLMKTN